MTTTDTAAHDVEERLETRARTMNWADSPFAGEDHTYTRGYYGPLDRDLDREAASLIRQLRDENGALKHDIERYVAISSEEATRAESAEAERDGAVERSQMLFGAKNYWRDRAETAEAEVARLRAGVEAMGKALEPFAEFGHEREHVWEEDFANARPHRPHSEGRR